MPNKPPSPPVPWKARIQVAFLIAATDAARCRNGTVNRTLLSITEPKTAANPKPVAGACTTDVTVDSTRNLWMRIFAPSDWHRPLKDENLPIVVYFHGGGFTFFSASTGPYDDFCRRICREMRVVVLSVNYRLAPEHRCPAAYDDGIDVLKFVDSGGLSTVGILTGLGLDLGSCFLAGDSAGGNIIHHVARRWAAAVDSWEQVRIKGIVAIQPYFGGEERTEAELRLEGVPVISMARTDWGWKVFLPEGANRNHEAAHVFGEALSETEQLEEAFPPAMVVVGGYDPLQEWQKRYYSMLKGRGKVARLVEYPDVIHGFYVFTDFVESGQLMQEMKAFLKDQTSM